MVNISVITANVFNKNPYVDRDLRLLTRTGAKVIGLNEAGTFLTIIEQIAADNGYRLYGAESHGTTSVLLTEDIGPVVVETRKIASNAGGSQANRHGHSVKFPLDNVHYAVLNVHLNAGVQDRRKLDQPRDIPSEQVQSYVASMKVVTDWAQELRDEGFRVIVMGDMNWAYRKWTFRTWRWSPQRAFKRKCGMKSQFDYELLPRPKNDKWAIEYVFFHPADFKYVDQRFVGPETSDHPFHEVLLLPRIS